MLLSAITIELSILCYLLRYIDFYLFSLPTLAFSNPLFFAGQVELSFQTGDIIYVYGDMDDDGFYMGELRGTRGLVPSNFLQEAPNQDYPDDMRCVQMP